MNTRGELVGFEVDVAHTLALGLKTDLVQLGARWSIARDVLGWWRD